MQKQKRQIIFLVIILILCIAAYAGTRMYNAKTKANKEKQEKAKITHVAKIKTKDITAFSYTYNGSTLSFTKNNDTWTDDADSSIKISQSAIETMLGNLTDIKATDKISKYDDTKTYGFDEPTVTVNVTTKDKDYVLTFGNTNSMINGTYMMADKDTTIYVVETTVETAFEKTLDELKEAASTETSSSTQSSSSGN